MAQTVSLGIAAHIAVINGQPTTTTRDIAAVYAKQHDNVLRVVRQRMAEAPAEWCLLNFEEASIEVPQPNGGTATYPVIRMTKKGFHFVVGKFTGAKAVQHQIAFADEFERMEAQLLNIPQQLPPSPGVSARKLLLDGQSDPVPMPAVLHKAIDKAAWRMAGEAYELARKHLARRVAFHHVNGFPSQPNLLLEEALEGMRTVTLGDALTHAAQTQLASTLSIIRTARDLAQDAAENVERHIAALSQQPSGARRRNRGA